MRSVFRKARNMFLRYRSALSTGHIIVFDEYSVAYFAIPKVANSSMKSVAAELLKGRINKQYLSEKWGPLPFRSRAGLKHLRDKDILVSHKRAATLNYWRFCFVRNPWDRLVSCYSEKINPFHPNGVSNALSQYDDQFYQGMTFQTFVDRVCDIPDSAADRHFRSQHCFFADDGNNCLVDYIGFFEIIEDEFDYVSKRCGFPPEVQLPHLLKSKRKRYQDYYDAALVEKVASRYAEDIKLLGYEFDGGVPNRAGITCR